MRPEKHIPEWHENFDISYEDEVKNSITNLLEAPEEYFDAVRFTFEEQLKIRESLKTILGNLTENQLLCQLAEEASELAQAALKLVRINEGTNPTSKTEEEVRKNLTEEVTDVQMCLDLLSLSPDEKVYNFKLKRWANRIMNK